MDVKLGNSLGSALFYLLFFGVLLLSISATVYRYYILEDFEVFIEVDEAGNLINLDE